MSASNETDNTSKYDKETKTGDNNLVNAGAESTQTPTHDKCE